MMKYLIDTHVVLWIAENSVMLSANAKDAILDENNEKYVSIVSAWEIAIKLGTGRLKLNGGVDEFFRMTDDNGFFTLSVEREYIRHLERLSDIHKDPFDRLIVATAMAENMTVITADENIHKYDVQCLW